MSVEQAKAFMEKLDSDKTFLTQIARANSDEARLQLAQEAGFDFTAEEFASAMELPGNDELSDDELEAVAGGYLKIGDIAGESFKMLSKKWKIEWTW